jgi:hypothetical protein
MRVFECDTCPGNEPGSDCHHVTMVYVGLVHDNGPHDLAPHDCGHDNVAIFYAERFHSRWLNPKDGLEFSGDCDTAKKILRDEFSDESIPLYRLALPTTGEAFKAELGAVLREYPSLQDEDPEKILKNLLPELEVDGIESACLQDLATLYLRGTPEEFEWMAEHWEQYVVAPNDNDFEAWKLAQEFGVVGSTTQGGKYFIVYRLDDENGEEFAKSLAKEYRMIEEGYVFGQILGVLDHPEDVEFKKHGCAQYVPMDNEWDSCWGYVGYPKDLRADLHADARAALARRGFRPEDVRVIDEDGDDVTASVLAGYEPPPVEPPTPGWDVYRSGWWNQESGDLCQSP